MIDLALYSTKLESQACEKKNLVFCVMLSCYLVVTIVTVSHQGLRDFKGSKTSSITMTSKQCHIDKSHQ
jgi:hypothetical protein